jgi:quaternary ammonium compound-resistance protein SugE
VQGVTTSARGRVTGWSRSFKQNVTDPRLQFPPGALEVRHVVEVCAMAWLLIVIAGLFETGFAVLLKQSAHFTRLWPTVGFAVCALISFGLLSVAVGRMEVGPAYALWTGIGAAGTAVVGIVALGESSSMIKLVSIGLIVAGVIGLNLSGVTPE